MSTLAVLSAAGSAAGSALPPGPDRSVPLGTRLRLDAGVRSYPGPDGGVLLGGSPLRVLRLNRVAWRELTALAAGRPAVSAAGSSVAGSLLDAGLAQPILGTRGPTSAEVTVVVPTRDRPAALARCLQALGPVGTVIVVDDASRHPSAVAGVAAAAGARVLRRPANGGPAAARNTGLAACHTDLVAFVDSDCVPEPDWLARLLAHFADPAVAAVAPRVVGLDAPGWLGRYEQARSALDLGPRPGPVVPRTRIAYVPAAALVTRRAALGAGFSEKLRVGEDVDLVWRLHAEGWRVRYEPAALVGHDHRVSIRGWARRKFDYGTSAGPLARRHPGLVPPAVTSLAALLPLVLLRRGRPLGAAAAVGLAAAGLARRLPDFSGRRSEAVRLAATGVITTGYGVTQAATRAWLPLTLALATRSANARMALAAGAVVAPLVTYAARRPQQDPLRWVVASALDDASYCAGLWVGALRARTLGPLLPAVPELAASGRRLRAGPHPRRHPRRCP